MPGTAWRRWSWLDRGAIPLAAVLTYAAWTYPLFALFLRDPATGTQNPGFTFWLCLGLLLGGYVAGRLSSQSAMGKVIVIVGGLAAVWISLLLVMPIPAETLGAWFAELFARSVHPGSGDTIPASWMVILCAAVLWWRGMRIARVRHEEAVGSFVVGIVALAGLLLLGFLLPSSPSARDLSARLQSVAPASMLSLLLFPISLVFITLSYVLEGWWGAILGELSIVVGLLLLALILPFAPSPEALFPWLLLFLVAGAVTPALLGVSYTMSRQAHQEQVRRRVERDWILTMFGIVGAVLLLGLLLGQLMTPNAVISVLGWLKPLWEVVQQILLLIVFAFSYVFFRLLEPLLAGLEGRPSRSPAPFTSPLSPSAEDARSIVAKPIQIPALFGRVLPVALALGGAAIVVWLFWTAVQRRKFLKVGQDNVVETRETILSFDLLQSQVSDAFGGLRRRRRLPPFLDLGQSGDTRRIVRELYQCVLAQATALNAPRLKGQTPEVYMRTLVGLCPEERSSLEALTRAYNVARYGTVPPPREQVQAVQEAFIRIDSALQAKRPPKH